jgi:hypothetical protein
MDSAQGGPLTHHPEETDGQYPFVDFARLKRLCVRCEQVIHDEPMVRVGEGFGIVWHVRCWNERVRAEQRVWLGEAR